MEVAVELVEAVERVDAVVGPEEAREPTLDLLVDRGSSLLTLRDRVDEPLAVLNDEPLVV